MGRQRLAQDLFRLSVELCPNGMVIFDADGRILLANAAMERMFGLSQTALRGRSIRTLLPACSAKHPGWLRSVSAIGKDGIRFPAEVHLSPAWFKEHELTIAVIIDVSERRRTEALKDEFVSTVSHELRAPLTAISGSLGLIAGGAAGAIPDPAMRLLTIAHKNSERLVRLINDILDIEKIESGKIELDLRHLDVRAVIEQAIESSRGYAQGFGVSVVLDPGPDAVTVRADGDRLVQVVTNLLSNACKFSPHGGEVRVAIVPGPRTVRITVRDHGPGIPAAFRPRVFEKFAQAGGGNGRQSSGTGLGLSIVRQIVTLLGGSVGFRDADGGGTEFHVDLPRVDDDAAAAARDPSPRLAEPAALPATIVQFKQSGRAGRPPNSEEIA